jgi:hypothetical protein
MGGTRGPETNPEQLFSPPSGVCRCTDDLLITSDLGLS